MTTGLKRRYVPGSHLAIDSPSFKAKEAKLDNTASGKAGPIIQVSCTLYITRARAF